MKDVTKILSERATRFLPVDMKDRLKSALNRSTGNTTPANPPADDVPDYSAIFNARAAGSEKKPRFAGPLDQTQLAEPDSSVTMRSPSRQIAHDNIEEAEIVTDADRSTPATTAAQSDLGWEAASLKTTRRAEASLEAHPDVPEPSQTTAAHPANDAPDYSAIFKSNKPRSVESNGTGAAAAPPELAAVEPKTEERRQTFAAELKPATKTESSQPFSFTKDEVRRPAIEIHPPKQDDAHKPKPRFFAGDFNSTESVRLKVEKRDERPLEEVAPAKAAAVTPEPIAPAPKPIEAKPRVEERPAPMPQVTPPVEAPREAPRALPETVAMRPTPPMPNNSATPINPKAQKENASMDAKGHETDNGAAARTDSASVAAIAIERNSKFSGQLKFSGAIAIDGQVEGELVAERVVVHEGGVVNATVEGNTVVIAGNVKGDVYARNELEILPSGVVNGSVTAPAINVRRGGRVEGRCSIGVPRQ